jgi:hypothetical protein
VPDEQVAAQLNAEGCTTRQGLPWTGDRVQHLRDYHRIPTACPLLAPSCPVRGDGSVSVRVAAARLGVHPSALVHWHRWGFLPAEQHGPGSPLWVRLPAAEVARLDGTLAQQGYGDWTIREAEEALGVSRVELRDRVRRGELSGYRARVRDHWEWRISQAEGR